MFSVTRLIHLAPNTDAPALIGKLRTTAEASEAQRVLIERTLPGVRNGGDILMNVRFRSSDDWATVAGRFATALATAAITHIDGAEYRGVLCETETSKRASVFRTLLLRVAPDTDDAAVERFEADLRAAATLRSHHHLMAAQPCRERDRRITVDTRLRTGIH